MNQKEKKIPKYKYPYISEWFELTYAQYLTIPRSILESMPEKWQKNFVKCLNELDKTIDWMPETGRYRVQLMTEKEVYDKDEDMYVTKWGHQINDPLMNYRHPNLEFIKEKTIKHEQTI